MNEQAGPNRLLLVDDEADIREVIEISLADMGYTVLTAENGVEALAVFKDQRPPVVLTDIKMPGMDGITLLKKIKAENPDTEVIMITGHGDMDLAVESLKNAATDFITKPVNVDGLEVALKRARDRIVMRETLNDYTRNLERLVREKTELQDHLSSLGLMISSISHGIKGLLAGLDGGMYLMDSGFRKEDPARVKEGWDVVQMAAERMRKMVLDILYYAKKRDLNWERVDVLDFAEELAKVVEPKMTGQGITLVRDFHPSASAVKIDPGAVHSALVNILDNAVDACAKDGSKTGHTVRFGVRPEGDDIVFTIADDGVGMGSEQKERIFDLFFSAKGSKGTGLGLFIAQRIIAQHGGTISVSASPGKGARFKVRIPRSPAG